MKKFIKNIFKKPAENPPIEANYKQMFIFILSIFALAYVALGAFGAGSWLAGASVIYGILAAVFGGGALLLLACIAGCAFAILCGANAKKSALNALFIFALLVCLCLAFINHGFIKYLKGFELILGLLFILCLIYINFNHFFNFIKRHKNTPKSPLSAEQEQAIDEAKANIKNANDFKNTAADLTNEPNCENQPNFYDEQQVENADLKSNENTAKTQENSSFFDFFRPKNQEHQGSFKLSDKPSSITELPPLKPLLERNLGYGDDASSLLEQNAESKSDILSKIDLSEINTAALNNANNVLEQELKNQANNTIKVSKTQLSNSKSTLESWDFSQISTQQNACADDENINNPDFQIAKFEQENNQSQINEPVSKERSDLAEPKIIYEDEPQSAGFLGAARKKVAITKELEENKALLADLEMADVAIRPKDFKLPPLELLTPPPAQSAAIDERMIDEKISRLLAKLAQFKIEGDVVRTYTGPVVTTFEFKPAANVKLSKIAGLADDLAMELKALSIRIQAPIPGKDVVGIEIPNDESQTIYIRELFSDALFSKSKSKLTIALGKDIVGNSFITDLKKLPHLLIAGTTGSGKSVGINAMVLSLLYRNSPRSLRLLMIDPKMLEFSMYNDIPHLLVPVITRAEKATLALKNMVAEMERRYELMAQIRVKDIESFNEKCASCGLDAFAYIVIIIDELADLMMCAGKEVEVYIARLAQMARACGMHLIVATQRPSVDVITGLIKANLPSRLSYKVSTQMDSKVILDGRGAESLLGRGDSLFTPPGTSSIVRLHAPFSSEEEIIKVVEFLKEQEPPNYDESILSDPEITRELTPISEKDELYEDALRVMREDGKTSISYLQRRLQIGYNRAANIIEQLEASGFLSAPNAKGIREIIG